jgi:DNA-binding GntR family transcriptional regulator
MAQAVKDHGEPMNSEAGAAAVLEQRFAGLEPVSKDSLTAKAYARIRSALMLSRFQPGQRLALRPLAAELGISPTPVREALLRLVSEHALTLDPRGIVCVPVFDAERFREVWDIRVDLEGQAAAGAIRHATAHDVAAIEGWQRRFADAGERGDFAMAWEANEGFHMTLYRIAQKPVLLSLIESLWMRCGPFFLRLNVGGVRPGVDGHEVIIRALRDKDADLIRRGVRDDITSGWRRLTEAG